MWICFCLEKNNMDLFLFLITICSLTLITTTQPFIDCSGKSFLCENSTHFTICVDVGGGVSMTVGNIVLSCPPTTFCDEDNAFECEYRTSIFTTPSPVSHGTDTPTETTEVRFTTNVYDEFLFTSDLQQEEENIVFPTQQKYIIPGNANVIFDDTDNAVLVYGNIETETVKSTPVNEKVTKNINITRSDNVNGLNNKNNDVYKKFLRQNKGPTTEAKEARDELSTTIVQSIDIMDNIMTTSSDLPSDSVITEETSSVEYVTTSKDIEISVTPSIFVPDIGSNHSQTANNKSSLKNNLRNEKKVDLTTNFTMNKLGANKISAKIIDRSPFNALESKSTFSDAVSDASMNGNISHTDENIKGEIKETFPQNKSKQSNLLKDNEDTIVLQSTTVVFTDATLDLNIPTERYAQDNTYSKAISPNPTAHLIEEISTTPDEDVKLYLNIPIQSYVQNDTSKKDIITSNSTKYFNETVSTPYKKRTMKSSTTTERYAENATTSYAISSDSSTHQIEVFSTTPNKRVTPNSRIKAEKHAKLSKEIIPLKTSEQHIKTNSTISNKIIKTNLSTPPMERVQNSTLPKDVLSNSSTYVETISTTPVDIVTSNVKMLTEISSQNETFTRRIFLPDSLDFNSGSNLLKTTTLRSDNLGNVKNTKLFENLVHPTTTVKSKTSNLITTTKTYILDNIRANPIIPSESSESDITFGEILKVNKDSSDLNLNSKLDTNIRTVTELTTENIDESQQTNSYQTTRSSNDLEDIKNTMFEYKDYSIALFPASTVETLLTELSTTPETFFESNVNSNPIIQDESPDFDISFGDLIKGNKDFLELKSPLQISFTDRPISDFNGRSENRESLRNFKSTLHNNSLNYDLASNSSKKIAKLNFDISNSTEANTPDNISVTNKQSLNKDLLLNNTSYTSNLTLLFINTKNGSNAAEVLKESIEKIQDPDYIMSQRYNLSNPVLHITTEDSDDTNSNKPMENSTYLSVNENKTIDSVPMSNVLLQNVTEKNYKNLNDKEMEKIDITRKDMKIIKRTDGDLTKNTINELMYSTQSTTETSHYFTNTKSITTKYNISGNKTINSIKNNTSDLFNGATTQNNLTGAITPSNNEELPNNIDVVSVEKIIEPNLNLTNTSIDLVNNIIYTEATISNSVNSKYQTKGITEKAYMTEAPIPHSSTLPDGITNNQPAILFNGGLNTAIIKDMDEKIKHVNEIDSPKYNLSNRLLSINAIPTAEKMDTNSNEKNKKATYLTVSENGIIDKLPISSVLSENSTVGNYKNLYDKDIGVVEITDTAMSIVGDKQDGNKIIKRTDSELLNNTLNEFNYSALSTLETSNYLSNSEDSTVSYDQNETIVLLHNNKTDLLQSETSNNGETVNNNSVVSSVKGVSEPDLDTYISTSIPFTRNATFIVIPITNSVISNDQTEKINAKKSMNEVSVQNSYHILDKVTNNIPTKKNIEMNNSSFHYTENTTEHSLQTSTTNYDKSISRTLTKVIMRNETGSPTFRSMNTEGQETDHSNRPNVPIHTKVAIVNSSMIIKNKQYRRQKQQVMEYKRNKDVKEFATKTIESVTEITLKKPKLTTTSLINDESNNDKIVRGEVENTTNKLYNTKHNISSYSKPTSTIPNTLLPKENVHLSTERENILKSTKPLSNNNVTSVKETTTYETYNTKISNKKNYQNTLYDAFVNSINKEVKSALQKSNSTNKNCHQTSLRLEEDKIENITEGYPRQVNKITTILQGKFNSLNSKKSTFTLFNKTNYSIKNSNIKTSKISLIDQRPLETSQKNESVMNIARANINNATVNKLEKVNVNFTGNYNISRIKPVSRGQLQLKVHNITTKSIDQMSAVQEESTTDKDTEQPKVNLKKTILVKESKNESTIGKCSDRSFCITQGNGEVSIELYNKTRINVSLRTKPDSKTKKTRIRHTDHVSNTTIEKHQNNLHINVTILPRITTKGKEYKILNKNEMPTKDSQTKPPLLSQNSEFQSQTSTSKTNIETPTFASKFDCRNHSRGRYSDKDNCKKFYICIGVSMPIVGICPENTVFSEFKKQCTNNLSHCIRNNQFKCVRDGRFIDVWHDNMYYVCIKGPHHRFLRLKLECKSGYILDKVNVMCKQGENILKMTSSTSSNSSSSSSSSSGDKNKKKRNKKSNKSSDDKGFKCKEEGKFVDPNNCRKYYVCSKTSKSVLRRKRKKCDSDEVFDDDKKKCVDEDSYEGK